MDYKEARQAARSDRTVLEKLKNDAAAALAQAERQASQRASQARNRTTGLSQQEQAERDRECVRPWAAAGPCTCAPC